MIREGGIVGRFKCCVFFLASFFLILFFFSATPSVESQERAGTSKTMARPKIAAASLLSLSALPLALSQFVQGPANLAKTEGYYNLTVRYKEVASEICELTPGVKSYSGYVDVAPQQSVFWWFFEARNVDPEEAPLTVWINGGPGSSSMIGLFEEIGPCWISEEGAVEYNEFAWK